MLTPFFNLTLIANFYCFVFALDHEQEINHCFEPILAHAYVGYNQSDPELIR
jgi:hypothetical protein